MTNLKFSRFAGLRAGLLGVMLAALGACTPPQPVDPAEQTTAPDHVVARYGERTDNGFRIARVRPSLLNIRTYRVIVAYTGPEEPGTIVVDPYARFLYLVTGPQRAYRYGIAVGRAGKGFSGNAVIRRKEEWPGWTPTQNMIRTQPELYAEYADGLPGGPSNPLGARALYLYKGKRDTYYRIHGTNDVTSIGHATSAGCIRLFNHDALDLFERVPLGTRVKVRTPEESQRYEGVMQEQPDGTLLQLEPPAIWPDGVAAPEMGAAPAAPVPAPVAEPAPAPAPVYDPVPAPANPPMEPELPVFVWEGAPS